ncbi:YALI0E27588p [Yarrowia lipolytica CLIB122]|jgi:hypothetical protein|uniref:YALI0E27588p n=3 Tax=Yarrowia lipolytica TaxID=4952 RepID=Q6C4D9_YARLI|nr:YALI0E27588p [Yarrowia lipolytica CLIB122]AOW06042.1 hypothetical protein YALI1_E32489g [Yarrowia lipolytica]KAJ8057444.1 hypothetical protein LXG23DRAFT_46769 [Yarrowia lipolytica]CAG80076.1 YALI0E27588p [Yarrowia lipolytica CLIB122]VBB77747.1 Hypothetical protein conserved in the Yarrowia clade [Yarrowia lipolytica]|eukprot:XP_504473.1 YALI0E27588p [Yarrowia lipolytica CLIB122]
MVPLLYLALRCPSSASESRLRFAYRNRCVELLQSPQGRETFDCMSYAYQILVNSPLRDQYDEADERDSVEFLTDLVEQNGGVVEPTEYFMQQWGLLGTDRSEETFIFNKFSEQKGWELEQNFLPTADTGIFKRVFPTKHVPAIELHLVKLMDPSFLSNVIASDESLHSFFEESKVDFSAPFAAEFLYLLQNELVESLHPPPTSKEVGVKHLHVTVPQKKHKFKGPELHYYAAAKRAELAETWFLKSCQNKNIPKTTYMHILYYVVACELLGKLAAQWHNAVKSHLSQSDRLDALLTQLDAKTNEWLVEDVNSLSENIAKTGENEYNQNFFIDSAYNGFTYTEPANLPLHESLRLSEYKNERGNGMWTERGFFKDLQFPFRNEYYRLW